MDDELKNNLSTFAVLLYGILAPYLAQYLSQEQFSALFLAVISIVLVVYSARHPNTMELFGNAKESCKCDEEIVLNEEYEVDPIEEC